MCRAAINNNKRRDVDNNSSSHNPPARHPTRQKREETRDRGGREKEYTSGSLPGAHTSSRLHSTCYFITVLSLDLLRALAPKFLPRSAQVTRINFARHDTFLYYNNYLKERARAERYVCTVFSEAASFLSQDVLRD